MTDINYIGTDAFLIPLGKINSYIDSKDANLFVIPMPAADSSETEAVDSLGIAQYINIEGRMTGDFSSMQTKISQIKLLADGYQIAAFKFKSPFVSGSEGIYTVSTVTIPPIPPATILPTTVTVYTKTGTQLRQGNIGVNTAVLANRLVDSAAAFVTWGTQVGDKVKNLNTGDVATVTGIDSATNLALDSDIFTASGVSYAVTATIKVKVMSISPRWELPGLGYVDYSLQLVQVAR